MREILFRGKNTNGEWVEGFVGATFTADENRKPILRNFIEIDCLGWTSHTYVYDETVGQYTGLTDKNGKKIFEGDIFKFPDEVWGSCYTSCGMEYDSWGVENYGVVGFAEYSAKYDFVKYKYNENSVEADLHENGTLDFVEFLTGLEIIGNIHDNPELLNGGAE